MNVMNNPIDSSLKPCVVSLPERIKGGRLSELLERIPYLSEQVLRVTYDEARHEIMVTHSDSNDAQLTQAVQELVDVLLASRILAQREERSNLAEQPTPTHDHSFSTDVFAGSAGIAAMEALDRAICEIAERQGAGLRRYPSVYQAKTMQCCGYHKNFPQNVFGVTRIPHDYAVIRQIRDSDRDDIDPSLFVSDGAYLQPCICYHCYEEWRDAQIETALLSSAGRCFRHEIRWKLDDFRRNEFTMREIAFVGDAKWVEQRRLGIMQEVWDLFGDLGLGGRIVTARDPFFHYDDMMTKGAVQLMADAKYELEFVTADQRSSSIASFNNCQDTLTAKFGITGPDGARDRHSGCVAFGLDRWCTSLFTRHGTDPAAWPETLRRLIG